MVGVYKIENQTTGRIYVGSSVDVKTRIRKHLGALRGDYHTNSRLQYAFNKYGEGDFEINILEETNESNLLNREQFYMDKFSAVTQGYNRCPSAHGFRHSEESKIKMSKAKMGQPGYWKNRTIPQEVANKISKTLRGNCNAAKKIKQLTKQGILIRVWDSATAVQRELNFNSGNIRSCANGRLKSACGFKWSFI